MTRYEAQGLHAGWRDHRRAIELFDKGPFAMSTASFEGAPCWSNVVNALLKVVERWKRVVAVEVCTMTKGVKMD
jgi:hypothetical protein